MKYLHRLHGVGDMNPDSKVHGANMGSIWGPQDPGGLHIGPINFAIWEDMNRWMHFRIL